jgi:hypothetical protein
MSQETPLNKLGNSMNDEDSRLVDSILNDLNSSGGRQMGGQQMGGQQMGGQQMGGQQMGGQQMGGQQMGGQQMGGPQMGGPQGQPQLSPEQHRAMLQQRQQAMMQQQAMLQQQAMMQQKNQPESILDKLQSDWKSILTVIVLSVLMNSSFVDGMFKMNENTYFILEDGNLNFQSTLVKALLIGIFYFLINRAI